MKQKPSEGFEQLLAHLWRGGSYGYWHYWSEATKMVRDTLRPCEQVSEWMPTDTLRVLPDAEGGHGPRHLFFGVHPSKGLPEEYPARNGNPRKQRWSRTLTSMIAAINCVYAEFDEPHQLASLPLAPSVIIQSSPGKHHCYWLLDEPFILESEADTLRARSMQAAWVKLVGSDPAAKDLTRVLRVPGTRNVKSKYAPAFPLVQIVEQEMTTCYAVATIEELCAPFMVIPSSESGEGTREDDPAEKLAAALAAIDRGYWDSYDDWLAIGMALHSDSASNLLLWDRYSRQSAKYRDGDCERKWSSFGTGRGVAHTVATVYWYANQSNATWYKAWKQRSQTKPAQAKPPEPPPQPKEVSTPEAPPATLSQRILAQLRQGGYVFRYNLATTTVEVNGEPFDDSIMAEIRVFMRDNGFKGMDAVDDVITAYARRNAYHPIQAYLESCKWDGQDHIAQLASYIESPDPDVFYADGTKRSLIEVYLRRWMIGAVAKAFHATQNPMLVLVGGQGIGKSLFAKWLCPQDLHAYFIESAINTNEKDSDIRLMSKFIWEVSELDATTRKADVAALKAFITKNNVTVRKPYGRHDMNRPALASMIGTINNTTGFMNDESGNRRFYAVNVDRINWDYATMDVTQLWAQAVSLYRTGESARLTTEEQANQSINNEQFDVELPMMGFITKFFTLTRNPAHFLSTSDIILSLIDHGIQLRGTRADAVDISKAMAALHIPRARTSTERGYCGIRIGNEGFAEPEEDDTLSDNLVCTIFTPPIIEERREQIAMIPENAAMTTKNDNLNDNLNDTHFDAIGSPNDNLDTNSCHLQDSGEFESQEKEVLTEFIIHLVKNGQVSAARNLVDTWQDDGFHQFIDDYLVTLEEDRKNGHTNGHKPWGVVIDVPDIKYKLADMGLFPLSLRGIPDHELPMLLTSIKQAKAGDTGKAIAHISQCGIAARTVVVRVLKDKADKTEGNTTSVPLKRLETE